jgi:Cdc6-like AAA superfamily ATPase
MGEKEENKTPSGGLSMTLSSYSLPERLSLIKTVFTPEFPITKRESFIGRKVVIEDCRSILGRSGAHIVLCGERGVGKSSMANILKELLESHGEIYITSCDTADTYETVWQKTFNDLLVHRTDIDNNTENAEIEEAPAIPQESYAKFGTSKVIEVLKLFHREPIIIFDEFDRLTSKFDRRLFADTIKNISDSLPNVKLIIVGVANDITSLIGEHASIERNLIRVLLPEMTDEEVKEIITKGLEVLGMTMEKSVVDEIVHISCGYPHFTHLLGLHACSSAVQRNRLDVRNVPDLRWAISTAIKQSFDFLRKSYQDATGSNRENKYEEVLWAAALAKIDEDKTFQTRDLLEPLSMILKNPKVNYAAFGGHLDKFCSTDRGAVLRKGGGKRKWRFRFIDPRMRAFILLKYHEFNKPPIGEQPNLFEQE